jgi:putative spermidine/putrescine transport system ATP-binding protein
MAQVNLSNVVKRFNGAMTVDKVSLEIAQGELLVLVGPSGCGKTTTLRMIAGLTEVDEGSIRFDNLDVTDLPTFSRNTGIVFQGYALFPHMTVARNVAFGLEMRGITGAEAEHRVHKALDMVQLRSFSDRLPKQLSGGQQQRVALARAIVINPDVLLLDEPLSALDAKLRQEVRGEIRRLQRSLGVTTVFVTHDQEEAVSMADRIVVMNAGKVEQIGTPQQVYEHPATRFVAEFIGLSNFLAGKVESPGRFRTSSGELLTYGNGAVGTAGEHLVVRPEKIEIGDRAVDAGANRLEGVIDTVTYLGPLTEVAIRLPGGERLTAHRQNRRSEDFLRIRPGAHATISWDAEAGFVL